MTKIEMSSSPIIQNIVCTCNLGSTLYLPGVASHLHGSEYNAKRFSAVTFRIKYPKTTGLFFGSGKMVCTGAKNINESRLSIMKLVNLLESRMCLKLHVHDFRIQNIVASVNMGYAISLEEICVRYGKESSYEPELFPGLIFRKDSCPAVFLIFLSGRIVITGAKRVRDIYRAFGMIRPIVDTCRQEYDRGNKRKRQDIIDDKGAALCVPKHTIRRIIPQSDIDWSLIDLNDVLE